MLDECPDKVKGCGLEGLKHCCCGMTPCHTVFEHGQPYEEWDLELPKDLDKEKILKLLKRELKEKIKLAFEDEDLHAQPAMIAYGDASYTAWEIIDKVFAEVELKWVL